MVVCPKCSAQLPDWANNCQFCQTDVRAVARTIDKAKQASYYNPPKWVWTAYYLIAVYFLLSALFDIGAALFSTRQVIDGEAVGFTPSTYVGIAFGVLGALVGIGLIFRIELARGIVNFFCALQLLFGFLGVVGTLLGMMIFGPLSILYLIFNVFDMATAAFMIYLIGETEKSAPNI